MINGGVHINTRLNTADGNDEHNLFYATVLHIIKTDKPSNETYEFLSWVINMGGGYLLFNGEAHSFIDYILSNTKCRDDRLFKILIPIDPRNNNKGNFFSLLAHLLHIHAEQSFIIKYFHLFKYDDTKYIISSLLDRKDNKAFYTERFLEFIREKVASRDIVRGRFIS